MILTLTLIECVRHTVKGAFINHVCTTASLEAELISWETYVRTYTRKLATSIHSARVQALRGRVRALLFRLCMLKLGN